MGAVASSKPSRCGGSRATTLRRVYTGRAYDRLINFTDAVVAVAITLLVLSIVDIRGDIQESTVWQIIGDHSSELITFAYTFLVVGVMWMVHNRTLCTLRGFDGPLFMLNLLWLMGIVLLPWPSALAGEGIGIGAVQGDGELGQSGAGMFYWGTLAFISAMAGLLSVHIDRHPELQDPDARRPLTHPWRRTLYPIIFLLLGVSTMIMPIVGSWLPLLLIPIGIAFGRAERRMDQGA